VRELGRRVAEGLVEGDLARRVHQVLLAAEHVGDLHRRVIDDHGVVVRRPAVALHDHEVAQLRRPDRHVAKDLVGHDEVALRHLEADDHRPAGVAGLLRFGIGREVRWPRIAKALLAALLGGLPHGVELFARLHGVVGLAGVEQPAGVLVIQLAALRLVVGPVRSADLRTLVPLQSEPAQVFEQLLVRRLDVAGLVGVLDAQHEFPAQPLGQQVVEQRRPRSADVQIAGRRRRETGTNGLAHIFLICDARGSIVWR